MKLYTLDLDNPTREPETPHSVSLSLDNGQILDDECVARFAPGSRSPENIHFGLRFLVFQADAAAAKLTISDWVEDKPTEPGQDLYYDFLQVQPYFMGAGGGARDAGE